ncbi:hypothetical protein [Rhizobium sp. NRK18]|uniref:hypothetical protein n=1 Tax=Rhizobium sp. NRK18 TaxID=2964667 RepID=UPI0021C313E5|nr:hypothetical protein [Rhizobium sp. NRK18]MCQ2003128.1 hypothetical protein [Rhizobium sp. NRK18]
MATIALNRRFEEWSLRSESNPDLDQFFSASTDALTWDDLLRRHRVVILAEAGSGKSTEMEEQARLNRDAGRRTFECTLQSLYNRGESAFGKAASGLQQWKNSTDPAWFFLDSIDEAKGNDIRLKCVLEVIAQCIEGAEARAHIILSGRFFDWETRKDFKLLQDFLAMPAPAAAVRPIDPDQVLINIISERRDDEAKEPAEEPLIVRMGALDDEQVRQFASGKGVRDADAFARALEESDLSLLAQRPLDLDWLVEYWQIHHRFGPLAEMLERCVKHRLIEPDTHRERKDALTIDDALNAVERIGAALVLQGLQDIKIPDSELNLEPSRAALDLKALFPDMPNPKRSNLIGRPVFQPGSPGFARLHNDNEGQVRSLLTARWLKRLLSENCPALTVRDLLFSTTYGVDVVIPSMRQTVAWLALWNHDVAREVLRRDPRLLMDAGDPASLSTETREAALRGVVQGALDNEDFDIPNRTSLKRFAQADLAPCVRELWSLHSKNPVVREVLLLVIGLGGIKECSDIVVAAAFGAHKDRYTNVFAGRALLKVASPEEKRRYAVYVRDNAKTLVATQVWDTLIECVPTVISVQELMQTIFRMAPEKNGDIGLVYRGPEIVDKVLTSPDLEQIVAAIFSKLEHRIDPEDGADDHKDEAFLPMLEAAGRKILALNPDDAAPDAAIDATIRLGQERRYRHPRRGKKGYQDIFALMAASPQRRRLALWRAMAVHAANPGRNGGPITEPWQLQFRGHVPDLLGEDFGWLAEDANGRDDASERQVAANGAMEVWRRGGEDPQQLERMKSIGSTFPEVADVIEQWTTPRKPSKEQIEHEKRMARLDHRDALAQAERDQSWKDFAARLRSNPTQLQQLYPPSPQGVDARLYNLYKLLLSIEGSSSHHAISDLSPLLPIFGEEVVRELARAFITYWRMWTPKLKAEEPASKRNQILAVDCIGITGVSIEATNDPEWAAKLSGAEATSASVYATLELNGFAPWIKDLARSQPDALRDVLVRALSRDLAPRNQNDVRFDMLDDLYRADKSVAGLACDFLLDLLKRRKQMSGRLLQKTLGILTRIEASQLDVRAIAEDRIPACKILDTQAQYIAALFRLAPGKAIEKLHTVLQTQSLKQQTALVQALLPRLVGDQWHGDERAVSEIPFEHLEKLNLLAFGVLKPEDDNRHESGKVYSPDERDAAESARSALFKRLCDTPGLATYEALKRLRDTTKFPIPRRRMSELMMTRLVQDSEHEAWEPLDVVNFEKDFSTSPRNAHDLQRLAVQRLKDIEHALTHADFAQGRTFKNLTHEVDVQNWVANELRNKQGRGYSLEREAHVADEKEPDVRLRAKATDANVPIEVKVAESWTLKQLEVALYQQMIGQYLRDRENRYGILLFAHQKPRRDGWQKPDKTYLNFSEIIDHLRTLAHEVAMQRPYSPQVEIVTLDVSSVAAESNKKKAPTKSPEKPTAKKPKRTSG